MGFEIARFDSRLVDIWGDEAAANCELSFAVPWLKPGRYRIDAYLCTGGGLIDAFEGAGYFEVSELLPYPGSTSAEGTGAGIVLADFWWSLDETQVRAASNTRPLQSYFSESYRNTISGTQS